MSEQPTSKTSPADMKLLLLVVAAFATYVGNVEGVTEVIVQPNQRNVVFPCPGFRRDNGDLPYDWFIYVRKPEGQWKTSLLRDSVKINYRIDRFTHRLLISDLRHINLADYAFHCVFKRPENGPSRDGKGAYEFKEERVMLVVAPAAPSLVGCPECSQNGNKFVVQWKAPSSPLNYTMVVTRQFLSGKSQVQTTRFVHSRSRRCKRGVCTRGVLYSQLGGTLEPTDRVTVMLRATNEQGVPSSWTRSSWPFCEGDNTPWWMVARQSSLDSITLMWSFDFGELAKNREWQRRALLKVKITGKTNNPLENCKSRDVIIPAFGSRLSSSAHAVEVHALTPGCHYAIDGRVWYVRGDLALLAPAAKRDIIATNFEATTTVRLSPLEAKTYNQHVALLLSIEVYSNFSRPENQIRIRVFAAKAVHFSKLFCGASWLKKPEHIAVVPRRDRCHGNCRFAGEVSYPILISNDALLFHECFRHQVAVMEVLNGRFGLKLTHSSVYDDRMKQFT